MELSIAHSVHTKMISIRLSMLKLNMNGHMCDTKTNKIDQSK